MQLEYAVTFKDFLESLKAYRRRARGNAFIYYLDVWIIPALGWLVIGIYLYGFVKQNEAIVDMFSWLAVIGLIAAIGLPLMYRMKLYKIYKQRTALSPSGRVSLEVDEELVHFHISDKVDVKYTWDAFTDYAESNGVLTLFIGNSTFNTIPRRDLNDHQWSQFLELVTKRLKKR